MSLIGCKGTEIKYVTIELLMKDAIGTAQVWQDQRDKVIYGLLKGIEKKKATQGDGEDTFILLSHADKTTKVCNLDVFNVLSFEVYDGIERDITFFRSSEEDQNSAFEMIEEVIKVLTEAKRLIGNSDLIDVSTFTDLPKDFSEADANGPSVKTGAAKTYNQQSHTVHHQGHTAGHGVGGSYNNHTTTYTREKEPTVFKRTSRKPTKAFLDKMRNAVMAIAAGEYEPKIPVIKNDKEDDDEKEAHPQRSAAAYGYDDEDYGYCC